MSTHDKQTDEELALLARQDQAAFGVLVERYSERLSRYARRLTRLADDDIYDVLQNVFLKAYRGLAGYNSDLAFSSWIYRITHNESISFLRKNKHALKQVSLEEDLITSSRNEDEEAVSSFDIDQTKQKVSEAINFLPEKYKTILVLYYFEEASYEMISDIMQLPPGTVATRIRRAKKKLESLLANHRQDL